MQKIILVICIFFLIISGLNAIHFDDYLVRKNTFLQADSLKYVTQFQIDYGLNNGISLQSDSTYNLFKKKVKFLRGVSLKYINLKSLNANVFIKFTTSNEIEKIQLVQSNNKGKKSINFKKFKTEKFGLEIGDSFNYVIKRLKGIRYKILNEDWDSKKSFIKVHEKVKFHGFKSIIFDEYICTYCFVNRKLNLIEINYFRDLKFTSSEGYTLVQK